MGNYIIEDEVETPYVPKTVRNKKPSKKVNYTVIGIGLLIVIIFIVIIASRLNYLDRYASLEKEMVSKTKDYLTNIGYGKDKEAYIDISKLNIDLPDDCSKVSGVFYQEESYTPYLVCKEYESKKPNSDNKINLIGNDIIFLQPGGKYYELGYSGNGDISVSGKVNTNQPGLYNVYYILGVTGDISVRKVIVLDNFELINMFPIISTSDDEIEVSVGEIYNDKVTAYDKVDGDLSDKLIKQSNVNYDEVGMYNNIYSVTNSFEYTTMKSQNVKVYNPLLEEETIIYSEVSNENMTNENVKINIKVDGGNYDYMILPDGRTDNNTEIEYEVSENGTYEFIAINKDETEVRKTIKIVNIDKSMPTGTCKADIYSTKTIVTVSVTSFNSVVEYKYIINDNESASTNKNSYTLNATTSKDVYVKLKDYIGNESKIKCTGEKKYNYDPQGYRKVLTQPARLTFSITKALSKKGYTLNDLNKCIYDRVVEAGPYTRYGVAAAAYGLIECSYTMTGYRLPYNHSSGNVNENCSSNAEICGKLGVASYWGSPGGTCNPDKDGNKQQCYHGLNCATFVRWAMCNGGMDLCTRGDNSAYGMVNIKYFPEADAVKVDGQKVTYVSGVNYNNLSADTLVRMLKPGDIVGSSVSGGHAFVVVGYDDTGIYTAEDGYMIRHYKYSTLTNGKEYYHLFFLDRYYANPKNWNHLYGD